jgi:uncharacterized protein (TIGR00369 family)
MSHARPPESAGMAARPGGGLPAGDPCSSFNRMLRGEVAPPPVFRLLGGHIVEVDAAAGRLRSNFVATADFLNPAGTVQGGMLGAMLDDLTASLVDATLQTGERVATLNLNLSFLRPARLGPLEGEATLVRRGRDVCHVQATLSQDGKPVASATATCLVARR